MDGWHILVLPTTKMRNGNQTQYIMECQRPILPALTDSIPCTSPCSFCTSPGSITLEIPRSYFSKMILANIISLQRILTRQRPFMNQESIVDTPWVETFSELRSASSDLQQVHFIKVEIIAMALR